MTTTNSRDPELQFITALSEQLAAMRANLDETAMRRVLRFVFDRHSIEMLQDDLYIRTLPQAPAPTTYTAPLTMPYEPPVENLIDSTPPWEEKGARETIGNTCPLCDDERKFVGGGLNLHMLRKHGTPLKEYRQQQETT